MEQTEVWKDCLADGAEKSGICGSKKCMCLCVHLEGECGWLLVVRQRGPLLRHTRQKKIHAFGKKDRKNANLSITATTLSKKKNACNVFFFEA